MICKNCGATMGAEVTECPYCGTPNLPEQGEQQVQTQTAEQAAAPAGNPLIGKEYRFSGNDLVIKGRWGVQFHISVGEDRLFLETTPARKNLIPAVMLEDILAIEDSFHLRTANIVLGVLGLLVGISASAWGFLIPILVLIFYRERKVTMHLRSGQKLTIYSGSKESVRQFIEDMKLITKIRK